MFLRIEDLARGDRQAALLKQLNRPARYTVPEPRPAYLGNPSRVHEKRWRSGLGGLGAYSFGMSVRGYQAKVNDSRDALLSAQLVDISSARSLQVSDGVIISKLLDDQDDDVTAGNVGVAVANMEKSRQSILGVLAGARRAAGSDGSKHDLITAYQDLINSGVNYMIDRQRELESEADGDVECGPGERKIGNVCATLSFGDDAVKAVQARVASRQAPSQTRTVGAPGAQAVTRSAGGGALDTTARDLTLLSLSAAQGRLSVGGDGPLSFTQQPQRGVSSTSAILIGVSALVAGVVLVAAVRR